MVIRYRHGLTIPTSTQTELDIKRLKYRYRIDDDRVAVLTAIHMVANMRVSDFIQFVHSYESTINEMAHIRVPKTIRKNKIDYLGGLEWLRTYKELGYTLATIELVTDVCAEDIKVYLRKRGLKWSEL